MILQIKFKSSKTSNKLMTSPPSCKKAGVGAGLDRRYIQLYVFRYTHAVYYSKTRPFCQDFGKTNYPVCPLTNRMDSGIIKTKRAYRKRSAPTWEYGNSRLSLVARDGYFRLLKLRYARYARNTSQTMLMHLTRMSRFIRIHSLPGVGLTAVDLSVRSCC